jgi:hypothetical protein
MNRQLILERLGFFFEFKPGFVFPVVVESSGSGRVVGDYITAIDGKSLKNLNNNRLREMLDICFEMER